MYTHTYIHIYIYHTHIHVYIYIHTYIHLHIYAHTHTHIYIYIYTCTHTHTHTRTHTYFTHTHTHFGVPMCGKNGSVNESVKASFNSPRLSGGGPWGYIYSLSLSLSLSLTHTHTHTHRYLEVWEEEHEVVETIVSHYGLFGRTKRAENPQKAGRSVQGPQFFFFFGLCTLQFLDLWFTQM